MGLIPDRGDDERRRRLFRPWRLSRRRRGREVITDSGELPSLDGNDDRLPVVSELDDEDLEGVGDGDRRCLEPKARPMFFRAVPR